MVFYKIRVESGEQSCQVHLLPFKPINTPTHTTTTTATTTNRSSQQHQHMNLSQKREEEPMKGKRRRRSTKGGGRRGLQPADFMVCFPTRAHLKLLPKPICSPSRPPNSEQRGGLPPSRLHNPLFKVGPLIEQSKSRGRGKGLSLMSSEEEGEGEVREPTSPKVSCAGQIKVRYGPSGRMRKRRPNWVEALGLKKDFFNLLAAFRGLRFKIGCFGRFHGSVTDDSTTLDDDDEEGEGQEEEGEESTYELSKWFTGLEEEKRKKKTEDGEEEEDRERRDGSIPPPNALLLMRCRSAPVNGLSRRQENIGGGAETVAAKEEEERLVFMSYPPDFVKLSSDIVKETWVVGSNDHLMRCRSWKR